MIWFPWKWKRQLSKFVGFWVPMLWIRVILTFHILTAPSYPSEAWSLAVQWPHSWAWLPTAGLPCLRILPKPVWVMWMRGEQEQPGTQQEDIMPNADWTWYLQVTFDVAAGDVAGLSCRVKHSSLGDQNIILYWGEKELEPSWGWEKVVFKNRGQSWGRGETWWMNYGGRVGEGEERVTEGEVGRERQRKRDRVWDLFLRLQCQRNENSWSKAGNR